MVGGLGGARGWGVCKYTMYNNLIERLDQAFFKAAYTRIERAVYNYIQLQLSMYNSRNTPFTY